MLCLPIDNFPTFPDEFESFEIALNNSKFLKLLNKTKIAISNDDTRHYLNGVFLHLTEAHGKKFITEYLLTAIGFLHAVSKSKIQMSFLNYFTKKDCFSALLFTV